MTADEASRLAAVADRAPQVVESGGTARLHLTLATTDYDHVRDLHAGVVRPEGVALTSFVLPIEEITFRFVKGREWDVSEMSFGKFIGFAGHGASPFIGLPVFPSRVFRHSSIYVRADRGIRDAKDLAGKRVGIPEWAQTAGIYARGFLAETAGVDLTAIEWVQAGVNQPGRDEKVAFTLPPGLRYAQRPDASLSAMLRSGEIDAAISARAPDAFLEGGGTVVRLYPDYRKDEAAYHAATGIFPIMHIVALRRAVFERYPWVAMNLLKVFEQAKARSYRRMHDLTQSCIPVPWGAALADEFAKDFGDDPFPYGLEPNRKSLEAFCRFSHTQGITPRQLLPDELFPKELQVSVRV